MEGKTGLGVRTLDSDLEFSTLCEPGKNHLASLSLNFIIKMPILLGG